jgi:hypothetical protein
MELNPRFNFFPQYCQFIYNTEIKSYKNSSLHPYRYGAVFCCIVYPILGMLYVNYSDEISTGGDVVVTGEADV